MPGLTSPLRTMDQPVAGASAVPRAPARTVAIALLPVRSRLLVAALLCTLLAALLWQGPTSEHSSSTSTVPAGERSGAGLASLPLTAQGPISAALGRDDPAYHVGDSARSLSARNPAQQFGVRFQPSGAQIRAGALESRFSLRAAGYGGSMSSVASVKPSVDANRITYDHGLLSEWFVNGPAGLEQGFTVPRAPAGGTPAALTLSIAVSGNARASLSPGAQSVTLRHGARSLRYGGLTATDAAGRTLHSGLALSSGALLLRVDTTGARYPITIDPLVQNGKKLTGIVAGGENGAAQFGVSAALSADGSTALIGGPRDDERRGAAWVFVHSGSTWIQQGPKFTPAETEQGSAEEGSEGAEECAEEEEGEEGDECSFGGSVALSADGNTALVGDPSATSRRGTVWVYTRTGSAWTRNAILTGGNAAGEGRFGRSVALSADGATALIGDPSAASQHGVAWVFSRSGSAWTAQAPALSTADGARLAHFGRSVSLSSDGNTALIGGPGDAGYLGAAWAFTRSGSNWTQLGGMLTGGEEIGAGHFGRSVSVSGDASTALIGGVSDGGGHGAAWVFARSGSSFAQQGGKLTGAPEGEPHFGWSVALSGDGNTALIGAPRDEGGLGTVTVFMRSGETWSQLPEQLSGSEETPRGWSGTSVALSANATVALVGAPYDSGRAGAAWAFSDMPLSAVPPPTVSGVTPGRGPPQGGTAVTIKGTNFTAATAVSFGSTSAASFVVRSATVIDAVSPPAPEGTVEVTVTTPAGTSALNAPADNFKFLSAAGGGKSAPGGAEATGTPGAAGGVLGFAAASSGCTVSLSRRRLAVARYRTAALRLLRTGAGSCKGKVELKYKQRGRGKRFKLKQIGTAGFSISPGHSQVINVRLSRAGQTLIRRRRGRLNASLSIIRLAPLPVQSQMPSVRLNLKKTRPARSGGY
jgi:IPT/TIG domain/FG-GAP repeat